MDTATVLMAGYIPMAGAIVFLFRELMKSWKAQLEQAKEHELSMVEFKEYLKKKNNRG